MTDIQFADARRNMVDSQILPNKVTDERLIAAIADLPREIFVPTSRRALSYIDESIEVEGGRFLMQPMVLARLVQIAEPKQSDVALVIGATSGYAPAVLSYLVETVVAIESDGSLLQKAERNIRELELDNVAVVEGDLAAGHPDEAPYDIILIDGGVPEVPPTIADQLSDGGRLVAVEIAPDAVVGRGVLVTKHGGSISKRAVFDANEPILPGYERASDFIF